MASTLERAKQGDASAFAELYGAYAKDFYRFAFCMLRVREDAEDAVQDAAVSVYKHLINIKGEDAFKPYFFSTLANECRSRLKKREERKTVPLEEISAALVGDNGKDFSVSLELQQAIMKLKDDERAIVLLSSVAGFKSSQIAGVLGVTSGTVRSKLSRSLKKLREELSK